MARTGRPPRVKVGDRVGLLEVVARAGNSGQRAQWLCECLCGCTSSMEATSLNLDRWRDGASCASASNIHRISAVDAVTHRGSCSVCGDGTKALWHKSMEIWLCSSARADARMRYNHGISVTEWRARFDAQGNRCAICGSDHPGSSKGWATDHDNSCCKGTPGCGQCLRSILCAQCNVGLGMFQDDCTILAAACEYLVRHGELQKGRK